MSEHDDQKIVILGAGGIGGTLAARLCKAGKDVSLVTANPTIASAIRDQGLHARFEGAEHVVHPRAVVSAEEFDPSERFALCIVAVPPSSAEEAVLDVLPWLGEDGLVLCCPNGLIEERLVGKAIPAQRIVGGVVSFGASMTGPGQVEQTSDGGAITLGRLPGAYRYEDDGLGRVAALLEGTFPTPMTDNLRGVRWSKLALNCVVSSLGTIGGARLGALISHRIVRRLGLEIITEVVQVARAEQVELVKVANTVDLKWLTLGRIERRRQIGAGTLVFKHMLVLGAGVKYRDMRSSMLRALERGRKPPVEFLNGEIVERGAVHGIPTPINLAVMEMIEELSQGKREPNFEGIEELYARTSQYRGWPTSWKSKTRLL